MIFGLLARIVLVLWGIEMLGFGWILATAHPAPVWDWSKNPPQLCRYRIFLDIKVRAFGAIVFLSGIAILYFLLPSLWRLIMSS